MGSDSGEFQDWEVLQSNSDSDSGFGDLDVEETDAHSDGVLLGNYFSLESGKVPKFASEESSGSSENRGWIEPVSEFQSSDSSVVEDGERKFTVSGGSSEVGLVENKDLVMDYKENEEITSENEREFKSSGGSSEVGLVENEDSLMGYKENAEITSENETESDGIVKAGDFEGNEEQGFEGDTRSDVDSNVGGEILEGNVDVETRNLEEVEKKTVVWWKVPLEFLKYCVFKVNPLWTFSLAAAAMGFLLLGRRLYNMKKRARSLQIKVTLDDKKVSQFMSRAARLNEAFSVVKRVPVVRPALPTVGVTPWPVMSLR